MKKLFLLLFGLVLFAFPHFSTILNAAQKVLALEPPLAFSKLSPPNGATNLPTSLTLTWAYSTGATSYEYCYDTTNDNACSSWTSTGSSTNVSLSGLSKNTSYYWHVRASNAVGTTYSNFGSMWSFTTEQTAAIVPIMNLLLCDP